MKIRFNNLSCEHCGEKLESMDDMSITKTGSLKCDYCDHTFKLLKCEGCGAVFRNNKANFVFKDTFMSKIYDHKPDKVPPHVLLKLHKCSAKLFSEDFHILKLRPLIGSRKPLSVKENHVDALLGSRCWIFPKERNKTQMKSKRYYEAFVQDYENGTEL